MTNRSISIDWKVAGLEKCPTLFKTRRALWETPSFLLFEPPESCIVGHFWLCPVSSHLSSHKSEKLQWVLSDSETWELYNLKSYNLKGTWHNLPQQQLRKDASVCDAISTWALWFTCSQKDTCSVIKRSVFPPAVCFVSWYFLMRHAVTSTEGFDHSRIPGRDAYLLLFHKVHSNERAGGSSP